MLRMLGLSNVENAVNYARLIEYSNSAFREGGGGVDSVKDYISPVFGRFDS